MPISHPLTVTFLSAAIFLGGSVAVKAQSDLPGCAEQSVKEVVLRIAANAYRGSVEGWGERLKVDMGWDLDPSSFNLSYITLADYNEYTGALTCRATLRGRHDREMWERVWVNYKGMDINAARERNINNGYWEDQALNGITYTVSQSAERSDMFVVRVNYD